MRRPCRHRPPAVPGVGDGRLGGLRHGALGPRRVRARRGRRTEHGSAQVTRSVSPRVQRFPMARLRSYAGRTGVSHGLLRAEAVAGRHLRPAGEEAAEGSLLIAAGSVLGPAHLGLAAAAGADTVDVVRRPTARVLVLGDELLDSGTPGDGRVRDALGPQVPAWLERLGVDCAGVTRVQDTLDAHLVALDSADDVDLVVTTGGTAAGPADHVHRAIAARSGSLIVDSVAVRPGHPMLLATLPGRRWLVGLPGNPQAAVAALLTLGGPLVAALLGRPLPVLGAAISPIDVCAPRHATRLVLAALGPDGVEPTTHHGSGMLRGLAVADGYLVVPPGRQHRGAGAALASPAVHERRSRREVARDPATVGGLRRDVADRASRRRPVSSLSCSPAPAAR